MRVVDSVRGRDFAVALPQSSLMKIQRGTLRTKYKGYRFCKSPFDIALYTQLIQRLKPQTIIEIGTSEGGSAVWFRDQCRLIELETTIYSFDITPPQDFNEQGIVIDQLDACKIREALPPSRFQNLPRPWLIIEDSAHTFEATRSVLNYFNELVKPGDYLVIEDGVVADLPGENYAAYADGPNRAVAEVLLEHPNKYQIDEEFCDFYGHNVTYSPNGWLKVID